MRWFDILLTKKNFYLLSCKNKTTKLFLFCLPVSLLIFSVFLQKSNFLLSVTRVTNASDYSQIEIKGIYATDIELLAVSGNPAILDGKGGSQVLISDDGALMVAGLIAKDQIKNLSKQKTIGGRDEIRNYIVREGDSLSEIANMFSISVDTLRWSNDLSVGEQIKPNQNLVILPVDGVVHMVKEGDTLEALAKKYKAKTTDIITFNHLSETTGLMAGKSLIVPNATISRSIVAKRGKAEKITSKLFVNPAPGSVRTQGIHGHNAVDLANALNSPIKAAAAGKVVVSRAYGWNGGYGKYIVIKHKNGMQTLYAHLNKNYVSVGDWVSTSQVIGLMGSTGRSTGPHLHFEVRGGKNPF